MTIANRTQALLHSQPAAEPKALVALLTELDCEVTRQTEPPEPAAMLARPGVRLFLIGVDDSECFMAEWLKAWDANTPKHAVALILFGSKPPTLWPPPDDRQLLFLDWCHTRTPGPLLRLRLTAYLRQLHELDHSIAQLGASEDDKQYRNNLLDSSLDMIISVDTQRRIVEFNESARNTFGYSQEEVLGKHVSLLYAEAPQSEGIYETTLREGRFVGEVKNRKKNGETFFAFVSASVMRDHNAKVVGCMGISRDMSGWRRIDQELRRAKEQAEAANRAKSQFLANMSHEMRTPISAVIGYAELLEEQLTDKPELVDYVDNIRRNSEHLLRLINDILDLSKVESGKLSIERIPCNPASIVSDCFHLLRTKSLDKGVHFRVRYPGSMPQTIRSDPTRILQCLVNLADNANEEPRRRATGYQPQSSRNLEPQHVKRPRGTGN
jgi:PAS domain S-box-containing protein